MWSAGEYPLIAERFEPVAEDLLDEVGEVADLRLLDVAAGTGNVALAAARRGARVMATDLTPRMVELGQARGTAMGIEVEWRVADAAALPVADGSVDVVTSCFGLLFVPDPEAVVAELGRVLGHGGRLGMVNWEPDRTSLRLSSRCVVVSRSRHPALIPVTGGGPRSSSDGCGQRSSRPPAHGGRFTGISRPRSGRPTTSCQRPPCTPPRWQRCPLKSTLRYAPRWRPYSPSSRPGERCRCRLPIYWLPRSASAPDPRRRWLLGGRLCLGGHSPRPTEHRVSRATRVGPEASSRRSSGPIAICQR